MPCIIWSTTVQKLLEIRDVPRATVYTHSQIWPYFFSYLPTCEVHLIEVFEIMAKISLKPPKMTSDFILNYLKKIIGGATTQKYENKYKNHDIFSMDAPPVVSVVSLNPADQTKEHSEEFQH